MSFVIPPAPQHVLPVPGSDGLFPVRNIYCVGQNYAAHAREMGTDPEREPPVFFRKPSDSLVPPREPLTTREGKLSPVVNVPYPPATKDLHHEVELVVALEAGGRDIAQDQALNGVFGYAVGFDLTRRDLQSAARKAGQPWDMAKGFDFAAPCSAIRPAAVIGHPQTGAIWLKVNGDIRQKADLRDQIWNVGETISCLSRLVTLHPGDLIFTGTPDGVGPISRGDRLEGHIDGIGDLTVNIV